MKRAKRISGIIKKQTGAILLYVMLIPLFLSISVSLFSGRYVEFILKVISFTLMALSAILVSKGISADVDYQEALIAKAPFPYKLLGAISLGLSIFILGFIVAKYGLFKTLFISFLSIAGVLLYYGLDKYEDKLPKDIDINPNILLDTLNEAKQKLASIKEYSTDIKDTKLKYALSRALDRALDIISTIEENPSTIRMARKFLVVYVEGIEEVIKRYKEIDKESIDDDIRDRLILLLDEAKDRFDKELLKLKESDKFELDVQIDALLEQLRNSN